MCGLLDEEVFGREGMVGVWRLEQYRVAMVECIHTKEFAD